MTMVGRQAAQSGPDETTYETAIPFFWITVAVIPVCRPHTRERGEIIHDCEEQAAEI